MSISIYSLIFSPSIVTCQTILLSLNVIVKKPVHLNAVVVNVSHRPGRKRAVRRRDKDVIVSCQQGYSQGILHVGHVPAHRQACCKLHSSCSLSTRASPVSVRKLSYGIEMHRANHESEGDHVMQRPNNCCTCGRRLPCLLGCVLLSPRFYFLLGLRTGSS